MDPISYHHHDCCFSEHHKHLSGSYDAYQIQVALNSTIDSQISFKAIRTSFVEMRKQAKKHVLNNLKSKLEHLPVEDIKSPESE